MKGLTIIMTTQQPKPKEKRWKLFFIVLAIINLAVISGISFLLFGPVPERNLPNETMIPTEDSSEFTVRTSKENLNELVNAYIDNLLGDSEYRYEMDFDKEVHLIGALPLFSVTVPLSIKMDPIVQKNGDVIMKLNSISVGLLELPNKKIMEYTDKYLEMPKWVTVHPKKQEIYVALTKMDIKSDFKVTANKIDLKSNDISFKISVPYETLGIEGENETKE